jgi:hypothetical protein
MCSMTVQVAIAFNSDACTKRTLFGELIATHPSCGTVEIHCAALATPHPRRAALTQAAKANTAQIVRLGVVAMGKTT